MKQKYTLQNIKNSELFFKYCDKIAFHKELEYLEPLELMLKNEKINPCRVKATYQFSILSMAIMGKHKELFNVLIKYANDDETPPELESAWSNIAMIHEKHYFNAMVKKGFFEGIKKINPDGSFPISRFIFKIDKKSFSPTFKNFFEDEMIKFFLEKGSPLNTHCGNSTGVKKGLMFHFLEKTLTKWSMDYQKSFEKALEYGFDINEVYNFNNNYDFIQDMFATNPFYEKDSPDSISNIDYHLNLMKIKNYKFESNKNGVNAIDILKEKNNLENINKINSLYECFIVLKEIDDTINTETLNQRKKRI